MKQKLEFYSLFSQGIRADFILAVEIILNVRIPLPRQTWASCVYLLTDSKICAVLVLRFLGLEEYRNISSNQETCQRLYFRKFQNYFILAVYLEGCNFLLKCALAISCNTIFPSSSLSLPSPQCLPPHVQFVFHQSTDEFVDNSAPPLRPGLDHDRRMNALVVFGASANVVCWVKVTDTANREQLAPAQCNDNITLWEPKITKKQTQWIPMTFWHKKKTFLFLISKHSKINKKIF